MAKRPCELSLLDHWNDIADVLVANGITLHCDKAYQAAAIIVETSRILNNHEEYDPKPEAIKLAAVARQHAQQILQMREKAQAEATMLLTDSMPIDKNKIN